MDTRETGRLLKEAFDAALRGDHEEAGKRLELIAEDSDTSRMFGVLAGIALPAEHALTKLYGGRAPDLTAGQSWYVLHLRPHLSKGRPGGEPWHTFSERFLTACLNGDRDQAAALYSAALTIPGEHFTRCVSQLFTDVICLCVVASEQAGGQER